MDLAGKFGRIQGIKILSSPGVLKESSEDRSPLPGKKPIVVVQPRNAKQVSRLMELCQKNRINVTVRGGGSSLTGASVPERGGIVIDMSRFNRIVKIEPEDRYAVVESGVTCDQLNKRLSRYNYFYPPDPASASISTIGGNISTNAGGLRSVMYGTTKEWVLALEVVLPDGKIINTGEKTLKRSIGYDITGLMIGSEGTLGIVTKATLKIWPRPERTGMVVAYFSTIESVGEAVGELKRRGVTPLAAEFIDHKSMELVSNYKKIQFPANASYAVFIEIATTRESMQRMLHFCENVMEGAGAIRVAKATSQDRINKIYAARKSLFDASVAKARESGRKVIIADIVVPASELPSSLKEMQDATLAYKLDVALFGHIGDGNVHANIIFDPKSKKERGTVDKLQSAFGRIAIRHGGSVSAEHGIGLLKKRLLKEEFKERGTLESLVLMKKIKKAFDPNGILNRGKIFD